MDTLTSCTGPSWHLPHPAGNEQHTEADARQSCGLDADPLLYLMPGANPQHTG
jgi:hypothetical protein